MNIPASEILYPVTSVKLCAPNDRNGNPRRLWLINWQSLTSDELHWAVIDDGYAGRNWSIARDKAGLTTHEGPSIEITAKEYKATLAAFDHMENA